MVLFLAAAGVGFTLLPSCGGGAGKDESAAGVVTVNDVKRGKKILRVYMNGTWMDIKPNPTGQSSDSPEDQKDDVASVPCILYLGPRGNSAYGEIGWDGQIVQYMTGHVNEEGIPDSASFAIAIDNQVFADYMNPVNLPWQLFLSTGASSSGDIWATFCSNLDFTVESFASRSGRVEYTIQYLDLSTKDFDHSVYIEVYQNN